jgi:nucleoside-diphosphate-sugar epimerase
MRVLLTGHEGYIGAVAGDVLREAGHEVVGLDLGWFRGCDLVPGSKRRRASQRRARRHRGRSRRH